MTSLRIALLTYATKPRGSVVHTCELATALTALGHRVCIWALDKDGQGFDRPLTCEVKLVPTRPAPGPLDALIQQRIEEFITAFDQTDATYDLYHAQDCIGANALAHLRHHGKIPHFVRTVHHIEDYASAYLQQCQHRSIRDADLCLCVSDYWQARLHHDYQIHAPRVSNGINLDRFAPRRSGQEGALKQRYGLTGTPLFLTVGGIEPRKNSLNLLAAFAQVLQHYPQAQLIIAGGATLFDYQPYRDRFFERADQLGITIGQSLILPGVITDADLPTLYRCADGFCFPSLKEGWGLVVLEAIASGLPVLLSDHPPFTEFLAPQQGVWVNPHDPLSIAAGMQELVENDWKTVIEAAQHDLLPRYTWGHAAESHLVHYQSLL